MAMMDIVYKSKPARSLSRYTAASRDDVARDMMNRDEDKMN